VRRLRSCAMANKRDRIKLTDDEMEAFLQGRHVMNVATFNHDGSIHLVAMWYGFLEGAPAFHTYGKSQKIQNLRRDPRITVLVEDGEEYDELRGAELVGTAEIVEDHDRVKEIGATTARRYFDPTSEDDVELIAEGVAAKRVGVRLEVERVVSWDHRKLNPG
jgi:PPOX class probable F420-dependent enzyme